MIKSLTSDDNEQQLRGVESMAACNCFGNSTDMTYCRHYADIRNYSKDLPDTLIQIISNNIIKRQSNDVFYIRPLFLNILLFELDYNFNHEVLPICTKIFNSISDKDSDDEKLLLESSVKHIGNPCKIDGKHLSQVITA